MSESMGGQWIQGAIRVAGIALVAWGVYFAYGLATAGSRVREVCEQIAPGMPVERLRALAQVHGLSPPRRESGLVFLVERRTFGRFGCRVVLDRGRVQSAAYNSAD